MKKSKKVMTVIVALCLIVLFMPMGLANASDPEASATQNVMNASLAGTFLTASVNNISEDVASVSDSTTETTDETPDTSDRTPIYIITGFAAVSFLFMAAVCVKEHNLRA